VVECDILVVGGGPAGLWAAKTASDWGFKTVVLEEHLSLGHTKHCSGWLLGCGFAHDIFERVQENIKFISASRLILRDAVSGDVMEDVPDTGWGGYLVRRELFDRELGKLAIETGAKLLLGVRALSFLGTERRIAGVLTSSRRYPEIQARVTICADGMKSAGPNGFAAREQRDKVETETYPGVQMELANVADATPGVIEIFRSSDPALAGRSLWPHGRNITLASFPSMEAYLELKARNDNALSRKLAHSTPIYVSPFLNRKKMGFYYPRVAQPGLLFAGEASGCSGVIHGMISGYYASLAAAMALRKMTPEDEAQIYSRLLKESDIYKNPFCYRSIREFYGSYRNWLERSKEIKV